MSADDIRADERERWAIILELQRRALLEGPDPNAACTRIVASVLDEWASRIRFNEPDGNNVPPGVKGSKP